MKKVVIKEMVPTEKELDIYYPIYTYFQDELGYDEYSKITEKKINGSLGYLERFNFHNKIVFH